MRVVGLLSGGKDSCYNLCHAAKQGHELVALATLAPPAGKDEIDSYMYQTVGHDAVHLVAQAMGLPLYRRVISGSAVHQGSGYGARLPGGKAPSSSDETEDLLELLIEAKRAHPDLEAVSVGAILSNYQRVRVEHVALRAGLRLLPLAYLWQRDQSELLAEMCQAGIEAVLIKVAGIGLDERCLGKSLAQMRPKLEDLNRRFGAHVCGEGGEYETLTLDSPLHKQRIVLDEVEVVVHSEASFASVSYLRIKKAHLEEKQGGTTLDDVTIPPLLDATGSATQASARKEISSPAEPNDEPGPSRLTSTTASAGPCLTTHAGLFGAAGIVADDAEPSRAFEAAFETLRTTLAQHDLTLADLSHLNVYLCSQSDFAALNAVYSSLFASEPPSRACIALGPGAPRIAIDAFGDAQASRTAERRKVVHVQGRSYWAAANIGPYSQAVVARLRICISGQIGLRPDDLTLHEDEATQMALSLQHARRILDVAAPAPPSTGGPVKARSTAIVEGCVCWLDGGESRARLGPRLAAARAAWQTQRLPIASEDDEDDEEEDSWLGPAKEELPTIYAVLPSGCLPRGAVVEWQLTAHEGIASADAALQADDDGDDDEKPRSEWRHIQSGNSGAWRWAVSSMARPLEPSTFGIAWSKDVQGAAGASTQGSELPSIISTAVLIRVLYDATVLDDAKARDSIANLVGPSGAAISYLGLEALFDADGRAATLAIVWQGA